MRALLVAVVMCGSSVSLAAVGPAHPFGLGFQGGDPAGFSAKYWLDNDDALQFALGWRPGVRFGRGYYSSAAPLATIDWTHHFGRFGPRSKKVWFRIHVGAGAGMGYVSGGCYYDSFGPRYCSGDTAVAAIGRVPVGFSAYLAKVRFEFFAQIVPSWRLAPEPYPILMGSAGVRYYF